MSEGFVTVRVFQNEIDAGLARSILETNGIPAFIVGAPLANVYGGIGILGRISLLVPEEQLDDALDILEPARGEGSEDGDAPSEDGDAAGQE